MKSSVVKTAKSVEEAVELALAELQVQREFVDVQVIEQPSRGLFGLIGAKPAIVRVSVKSTPSEMVVDFLEKICGRITGSVKVRCVHENEEELSLNLDAENLGLLIGKRGETLNALQYLATLVYNKYLKGYRRVFLNAGNYRERRNNTLKRLAIRLANQVMRTGRRVVLEPMNSYDRRIIHTTLQDFKGVTTYSEGEEPERRVVIAANRTQ